MPIADWLKKQQPTWLIQHVKDVGLEGKSDAFLYRWAQDHKAIILTFDEDFADARMYPYGRYYGVIRLRIWPTTIENTENALSRLFASVQETEIRDHLIIIDNNKIRIRKI